MEAAIVEEALKNPATKLDYQTQQPLLNEKLSSPKGALPRRKSAKRKNLEKPVLES